MTRNGLLRRLVCVIAVLMAMICGLAYAKFAAQPKLYELLRDVIPLLVALLAAYFAQVLQQRAAFVASLRSLWSHLIEVKIALLRYSYDPSPTWETYQDAYDSLSRAIDDVRSIYRNYGESKEYIGWYPYQPMHDMRKALIDLGFETVNPERQQAMREEIQQAWNALRPRFLAELGAPEPSNAIIERNTKDTRHTGSARKASGVRKSR